MSLTLLKRLNGNTRGEFRAWIERRHEEPHIAWYPSAGRDFRDLLYLHPAYGETQAPPLQGMPLPDIFLHTDCSCRPNPHWLREPVLYADRRTQVTVRHLEELPRMILPLDPRIVTFPEKGHMTGRVYFLEVDVTCHLFGRFSRPVLYAYVENTEFLAKVALPAEARFSHIVQVRYGGGLGGSGTSGVWLQNILEQVGCQMFISDGHWFLSDVDDYIADKYPQLARPEGRPGLEVAWVTPGVHWSNHGDVQWCRVVNNAGGGDQKRSTTG